VTFESKYIKIVLSQLNTISIVVEYCQQRKYLNG